MKRTVLLTILDGFGLREERQDNAIKLADTPNLDYIMNDCPHAKLEASSLAVGLPEGQMGNSEVGHMNIGSGRVVYQDLVRINRDIESGNFYEIKEFNQAIDNAIKHNSSLHLMGLLSDGGIHSEFSHLIALLKLCQRRNFKQVYIHAFLDGRDTPPTSGINYIKDLSNKIEEIGFGEIATLSGRYYAMDRDNRWDRVEKAYNALVNGEGVLEDDPIEAIKKSYDNNITDEFVIPTVITRSGNPIKTISKNDSVIFFNYRTDRAREITRTLVDSAFNKFDTNKDLHLCYVCMTEYDKTIPNVLIAYKPEQLVNTLGEYIAKLGLKQLRIAETEKYAHVTFFFNGGREVEFKGEDRVLIPSPKVATYDMQPEMSTYLIKDKVIEALNNRKYDIIILNFANTDMVGHTGKLDAAIKAVESVDKSLGEIISVIDKTESILIVTADHGNCETMKDEVTHLPHTAHTNNLVPFCIYGLGDIKLKDGALCDISPTILDILEVGKPNEMTGNSLIIK